MNPKIVAIPAAGMLVGKGVRAAIRQNFIDANGRQVTAELKKKVYDEDDQEVAEIYEDENQNEYLHVQGRMYNVDTNS